MRRSGPLTTTPFSGTPFSGAPFTCPPDAALPAAPAPYPDPAPDPDPQPTNATHSPTAISPRQPNSHPACIRTKTTPITQTFRPRP